MAELSTDHLSADDLRRAVSWLGMQKESTPGMFYPGTLDYVYMHPTAYSQFKESIDMHDFIQSASIAMEGTCQPCKGEGKISEVTTRYVWAIGSGTSVQRESHTATCLSCSGKGKITRQVKFSDLKDHLAAELKLDPEEVQDKVLAKIGNLLHDEFGDDED